MELGIAGRNALVCASSKGLGLACAESLAREGCNVWINGRDADRLERAAEGLRQRTGAKVTAVQADIRTEDGRQALVSACPDADILVNNNEGPKPGNWHQWGYADWIGVLENNMLPAIMLMTALVPGMQRRKFGRVVNITSAMVKMPYSWMILSATARTGLTAFSKALSLDVAVDNVTINNLLPERIDTDRQEFMAQRMMKADGITRDEARRQMAETIAAKRLGRPEEVGDMCAYLCSVQGSFVSGQNVQVDGGSYPSLI
ncbi:SDR family oxidoreductase [Piscinibacter koreensis]|uniref:SDR family oxidoreductase n=1 Tax=Piscinibacter koreensis TaxID=2742824 RepID=A0A7Y6NQX6_9BURK|nr:SDR family oxidoreductase [Schlegelella koreensis]NUZ07695.1 SDR family oxidoreductase [Schlegelella koreensis]